MTNLSSAKDAPGRAVAFRATGRGKARFRIAPIEATSPAFYRATLPPPIFLFARSRTPSQPPGSTRTSETHITANDALRRCLGIIDGRNAVGHMQRSRQCSHSIRSVSLSRPTRGSPFQPAGFQKGMHRGADDLPSTSCESRPLDRKRRRA